jgi:hypothetical protein
MPTRPSKDRTSLCSFSFADGRRCRMLRNPSYPHLCTFHARKESQALAGQQLGRDISSCLSNRYLSACDLAAALSQLPPALAQGQVSPKTALTLAYLGQTLAQSIQLAQFEYIQSFGVEAWRHVIRSSFRPQEQPYKPRPEIKVIAAPSVPAAPQPRN